MQKLLILTEAGTGIGFGHYTRCIAIYEEAILAGISTTFLLYSKGENTSVNGDIVQVYNWHAKLAELEIYSSDHNVLIDSYILDELGFKTLRKLFSKIYVIDDYNRLDYPADVLMNPNVYFEELDYKNQSAAKCYGGSDFVILRKPFRTAELKQPNNEMSNISLTLGGSDNHLLLPVLCESLSTLDNVGLTIICPNLESKALLSKKYPDIICLSNLSAEEMLNVFSNSDLVISACGQTLHELASIGKATIGICTGEDQKLNQLFYVEKGWLSDLINWSDRNLTEKVLNNIDKLRSGETRRKKLNLGPAIFNRDGVDSHINLLKEDKKLLYRLATIEDCKLYFNWVNDPDVRINSINTEPIEWGSHKEWYYRKIVQSQSLMLLFYQDSIVVGQVRIDWTDDGGWIDYSVDKAFRGAGLGVLILKDLRKLIHQMAIATNVYGLVRDTNVASIKAFKTAQFSLCGYKEINGEKFSIFQY